MTTLFDPVTLGELELPSRVVMAPMTRCRSSQPGNIPNALMATYYAQRSSAALIISEATQISPQGQGYSYTPGLHTSEQLEGWRLVTDAVHQAQGRIFSQLWHVGRMSHTSFHGGQLPVAPSALSPMASVWVYDPEQQRGGMVPCPTPRALERAEIPGIIEDYRRAALNALEAGFDGVELHSANGYLMDQFLRASSNHRDDVYGQDRTRFVLEVVEAVADAIGPARLGIRFAPFITQRGMDDPSAPQTILKIAAHLNQLNLAYIHLAEADWDDAPQTPLAFRQALRQAYSGAIIVAGGYSQQRAQQRCEDGLTDLVAFGRPFIANPDLPHRMRIGAPLEAFDPETLFGGDARGYTDYPGLDDATRRL